MRFLQALKGKKGRCPLVIPDVKCRSPKEGDLARGRDMVSMAAALVKAGAPVLSVVTEQEQFGGSLALLREISRSCGVPVLRKDFVRTTEELRETKDAGASAVLLMYACLEADELEKLYRYATSIGLNVLVETHTFEEMDMATKLGAPLVGINNRDIRQLERDDGDVGHTQSMITAKPEGAFIISESGLQTAEDVRRAVRLGADAVLVGSAIWKAEEPVAAYRMLCRRCFVKLCGIVDRKGLEICEAAGADMLGFVVDYPEPVPWNLTPERAERLIPLCGEAESCIVTGGGPDRVVGLAERLHPDWVQLHHRETLEETAEIASRLEKLGIGVIRTIPLEAEARHHQFGTADPTTLAEKLREVGVGKLLVDARDASGRKSQTGDPLTLFRTLHTLDLLPVLLGGGIDPNNVEEILDRSGADALDIMSGTETAPGEKSERLIADLMYRIGGNR